MKGSIAAVNERDASTSAIDAGFGLGRAQIVQFVRLGLLGSLLGAFLAGKFTFGRFFDEQAADGAFLELRLWFTLAAIAGLVLERRLAGPRAAVEWHGRLLWIAGAVIFMHAAMLVHVLALGQPDLRAEYAVDCVYIIVHVGLFGYAVRRRGDLLLLIYWVEALGHRTVCEG